MTTALEAREGKFYKLSDKSRAFFKHNHVISEQNLTEWYLKESEMQSWLEKAIGKEIEKNDKVILNVMGKTCSNCRYYETENFTKCMRFKPPFYFKPAPYDKCEMWEES